MTISSRTPEGQPNRCPICHEVVTIEPSVDTRDAPCPNCGHLLWWLHQRFPTLSEMQNLLSEFEHDSLDLVDIIMVMEEEFDMQIADEDYEQIRSIRDLIRYVRRTRMAG